MVTATNKLHDLLRQDLNEAVGTPNHATAAVSHRKNGDVSARSLGRDLGGGSGHVLNMSRRLEVVEQHMTENKKDMQELNDKLDMILQVMIPTGTVRASTGALDPNPTPNQPVHIPFETPNHISNQKITIDTNNGSERTHSASGISDVGFQALQGKPFGGTSLHVVLVEIVFNRTTLTHRNTALSVINLCRC